MKFGSEALELDDTAEEAVIKRRRRARTAPAIRPRRPENGNGAVAPTTPSPVELPSGARLQALVIRLLNVLVAIVALVAFLPLMVLIAVAIKLDSRGPIFYRQLRIGLDRRGFRRTDSDTGRRTADMGGRPFLMYKFRTMCADAENHTGPVWASAHDSRTTRLGRWLRQYRLDELPQFWNVLKGEMCVVGPRPERPSFVGRLRNEIDGYTLRQRVPPGITGWAQVNRDADQSLEDVREKLRYDLEYLYRRSLWFDVRIMMQTLPVMLERERLTDDDR